jgi:hypothetical protein
MKTKMLVVLMLGVFQSFLKNVNAQVVEISTDRPDVANSPLIAPKGALQIETGFMIEKENYRSAAQVNYTYNNTLFRYGVNEHFELRLNTSYQGTKSSSDISTLQGLGPLSVGIKIKLADAKMLWPQTSIISHINLRSGTGEFKPAYTSNDITIACSHQLSDKWSVTYNGGVKWNGESADAIAMYSLSFEFNISNKFAAFAESYAFFPKIHSSDHRIDTGLMYKLLPLVQCDVSAGLGLTKNNPEHFISTGLSIRLFN